ncbi:Rha family transcriptional regulator [Heyndrickxia oleronia]|uniref:Rha family transcriptional regulator n=1 Tax=Heyndrickxia oleronia TaxID=38875 RepID=UPI001B1CA4A9|nr:Rha family transcriptional regulator [Heyndrickxia oleronia]GIN38405.1 antirepressor [Heyndrickxia oleronia]
MNPLVFVEDGQAMTNSLNVAEVFGKEHKNVLKDIRELGCSEEFGRLNFKQSTYVNLQNKNMPMFFMSKKGFTLLVMGYTGKEAMKFKEEYIDQFEKMEEELRKPRALTDKEQRVELLKLTLEHEEKFGEYDERIAKLEDNVRIDAFQQNVTQKQIKKRVYKVFENFNPNNLELSKLFPMIHRNLRDAFGVPTYKDLRKIDYEEVIAWINSWRPLI